MNSDIFRWLLLIIAGIILCIWYLRYIFINRRNGTQIHRLSDTESSQPDILVDSGDTKKPESHDDTTSNPDNLIIISVGSTGTEFAGEHVISLLKRYSLKPNKSSVYQRHIQANGSNWLVYSVVNGIEPGYLDDEFMLSTTPSIVFFFDSNKSYNPLKAFNQMIEAAQEIASSLNGTLYDSDRNVITGQSIEYIRKTIREKEWNKQLHAHN